MDKDSVEQRLQILQSEKVSESFVKAMCMPIEKSISDLWKAVNGARKHSCLKEDSLNNIKNTLTDLPKMREDIGSWKFVRNVFFGALGTLIVLSISAIFAFASVKVDTENSIKELEKQNNEIKIVKNDIDKIKKSMPHTIKENELNDIKMTLKEIGKTLSDSLGSKKKKR